MWRSRAERADGTARAVPSSGRRLRRDAPQLLTRECSTEDGAVEQERRGAVRQPGAMFGRTRDCDRRCHRFDHGQNDTGELWPIGACGLAGASGGIFMSRTNRAAAWLLETGTVVVLAHLVFTAARPVHRAVHRADVLERTGSPDRRDQRRDDQQSGKRSDLRRHEFCLARMPRHRNCSLRWAIGRSLSISLT